jgi:6-phosphogluconolactonase
MADARPGDPRPAPQVRRYPDTDALTTAAATHFVEVVVAAQAARGTASVVLTGGGTGIDLLRKVRDRSGDIDWSNVDFYWGDDRFVPTGDPERNCDQARAALLDHIPAQSARVHPMAPSDGPYADAHAAAAAYAAALGPDPVFDLHLLGMGGEGHINSLFPHTDAVREERALVVAVTDSPKPPPVRITLTLPAVRRSRHVALIVAGAAKADAVAAALGGAAPVDIPAAGAIGAESTHWLLDPAAAAGLG